MKIFYLTFLYLVIFSSIYCENLKAQNKDSISILSSSELSSDINENGWILDIIGDEDGGFLVMKGGRKNIFSKIKLSIEKFDKNLKRTFNKELKINNTNKDELEFVKAVSIRNNPIVFTSYYEKSKDEKLLYFGKINPQGILDNGNEIGKIKTKISEWGKFDIIFNKDTTKTLIVERNIEPNTLFNTNYLSFSFSVYDPTFNLIWKSSVKLDITSDDGELGEFFLDDDGKVLVMLTHKDKKAKNKLIQELLILENGKTTTKSVKINIEGKIIQSIKTLSVNNNIFNCFAIYSNDKRYGLFLEKSKMVLGTIFLSINLNDGKVNINNTSQFSRKTFDFFDINKKAVEAGYGIDYLSINKIIETDKNYRVDILRSIINRNTDEKGRVMSITFIESSSIYLELDKEGNILKEEIVPIYEESNYYDSFKHLLAFNDRKVLYIFNTSPDNLKNELKTIYDIDHIKVKNRFSSSKVVYCLIENDKKVIRTLNNKEKDEYSIRSQKSYNLDDGTVIFILNKKKGDSYKLIKLSLN